MPVVLPKPNDPRLHLAAVITSLQVLGQTAFDFRVSIAQILLAVGTCAVLEIAITARKQHVWMWPASALLTGNGVAFILRVPGTQHGDWWSLHGWWIYVGTAAVSLLSKYVLTWRGAHVFNPSNIGLVLCFIVLGRTRAEPLDFWWGPMSVWLALALGIIVAGGFLILRRLKLLVVALGFWCSFAVGIAVLSLMGHAMVARWHLGPITGWHFWWVLLTSPEVLVFLFYMITDPKTAPAGRQPRLRYAVAIGLLATLLIAPMQTEWATKVALLGSLAVVCAARPILDLLPLRVALRPAYGVGALALYAGVLFALGVPARTAVANAGTLPHGALPPISIERSRGVDVQLTPALAKTIAVSLVSSVPARADDTLRLWLEQGKGQSGPTAVAVLAGRTYHLASIGPRWKLTNTHDVSRLANVRSLPGFRLVDVARQRGITFRQGAFRDGVNRSDTPAMMGGGVCWLDYDNDGWLDLFVVNSASEGESGTPRTALYHNVHGRFVDVSARSGAARAVRGQGCVAADLNGDGRIDLFVTTAQDDELLLNDGNGRFTEAARSRGIVSFGWHTGAAVADVNGDGLPDLYVAGYTERNGAIPGSVAGFPTNHLGVRDELFLNLGHGRFRNVAARIGLDPAPFDHSLGALFTDVNGDGRPDLYVANDEDANKLYLNEPGGPLGFRFVDVGKRAGVADRNAGMGIAQSGRDLFVSNSRGQVHASYRQTGAARFGPSPWRLPPASTAGWGASWIDLRNSGVPDLVLANGEIPIARLKTDAERIQVLVPGASDSFTDAGVAQSLRVNGRGLAAADFDNDGRVDVAVNSVGGPLLLLRNTSPSRGHWLDVALSRFAPGAVVTVRLAGGTVVSQESHAGSSYLSSEDPRLHFGLGGHARVLALTVRWPDGKITRMRDVRADRVVEVKR